jgi:hypothetical protein
MDPESHVEVLNSTIEGIVGLLECLQSVVDRYPQPYAGIDDIRNSLTILTGVAAWLIAKRSQLREEIRQNSVGSDV